MLAMPLEAGEGSPAGVGGRGHLLLASHHLTSYACLELTGGESSVLGLFIGYVSNKMHVL